MNIRKNEMRLLLDHLKRTRELLLKYSDLIGLAEHKTNLGNAREALITSFLKQNLPEIISYYTGEVFDSGNNRSGQIDIILHPNFSPKLNLFNSMNIFPVETVLAAIEVKTKLTTGRNCTFLDALTNCAKLKRLDRFKDISYSEVILEYITPKKIPYIIFALKGPKEKTLKRSFELCWSKLDLGENYFLAPDMIIVLSSGKGKESYAIQKSTKWRESGTEINELFEKKKGGEEVLVAIYELLLKLVESWVQNIEKYSMPIDLYIKGLKTKPLF